MIPSVYQTPVAETTTTETKKTGEDSALGMDAFLKMFMAQITHQNPLDPMDNTEYTAQLAQFSSLEQLTQMNESMSGLEDMAKAVDTNTAISYLGKEVTIEGDLLPVVNGNVGDVGYTLEEEASNVQVTVWGLDGKVLGVYDVGRQAEGAHTFTWEDGADIPDGAYKVTIRAENQNGELVTVTDRTVTGLVTGYTRNEDGEAQLLLGDAALDLDDVLSVRVPDASASSTASAQSSEGVTAGDVLKTLGGLALAIL